MKKPHKDPVRESRIHEEAIVDDYGPEEKAMSWYYYLEGKLSFPFRARCTASTITSPLKKGEDVEVLRMAPDRVCATDMLVLVRWQGRKLAVPLAQLTATEPDESTAEAIGDWKYWVRSATSSDSRRLTHPHRNLTDDPADCRCHRPLP
jgi:hypothetical protein